MWGQNMRSTVSDRNNTLLWNPHVNPMCSHGSTAPGVRIYIDSCYIDARCTFIVLSCVAY